MHNIPRFFKNYNTVHKSHGLNILRDFVDQFWWPLKTYNTEREKNGIYLCQRKFCFSSVFFHGRFLKICKHSRDFK